MTSIKPQSTLIRSLSMVMVMSAVLALSACGGNKKISTKDNSTEYKSARALPPLKKPASDVVATNTIPAPVVQAPVAQVPVAQPPVIQPQVAQTPAVQAPAEVVVDASVVESNPGQARLQLAADFDQAWNFLTANLKNSDITVFSRNKAAGRFSIGCANIAAAPTVVQSGRWSFFNRDKQESQEYCALQAVERRGITSVSVLNRAGEEVSSEYSNAVFQRILKN